MYLDNITIIHIHNTYINKKNVEINYCTKHYEHLNYAIFGIKTRICCFFIFYCTKNLKYYVIILDLVFNYCNGINQTNIFKQLNKRTFFCV